MRTQVNEVKPWAVWGCVQDGAGRAGKKSGAAPALPSGGLYSPGMIAT